MPVVREWFEVERVLSRKSVDGIIHYKIKWLNYKNPSWEPFYNVGEDLIREFERERHEKQATQRQNRYINRCIKKEADYWPSKSKKRKW